MNIKYISVFLLGFAGITGNAVTQRDIEYQNISTDAIPMVIVNGYIVKYSEFLKLKEEFIETYITLDEEDGFSIFGEPAKNGAVIITLKSKFRTLNVGAGGRQVDANLLNQVYAKAKEAEAKAARKAEAERLAAEAKKAAEARKAEEAGKAEADR